MLTSGTIWGIICLVLGVVFFAVVVVTYFWAKKKTDADSFDNFYYVFPIVAAIIALALVVPPLIGFGLVGYQSDYTMYKPVSGQVQAIASRQIADGRGMSTRFVLDINGVPYAVDDTRAALLKPGDKVSLMCTKEFVWGSPSNGFACVWA